jgi:hypothetical protein
MHCSISTLFTALLFSAAIMPNAMAQMYPAGQAEGSSSGSANIPEQSASDATKPTSTQVLPELPKSPAADVSSINSQRSRRVSRPKPSDSQSTFCSFPPRAEPGDWDYREALYQCMHGSD